MYVMGKTLYSKPHTGVCQVSGMGATVTGSCLKAAKKPGGSP